MDHIIYLDHAATTKIDDTVLKEMLPYLTSYYGNASSLYSLGKSSREAVEKARKQVANAINCSANEIYFTSCGSESDNLAIKGIAKGNKNRGRHIITSSIEHPAVLETCKSLEREGFEVSYVPVKENGIIDIDILRRLIRPDTVLISIMTANNEVGTIQPIEQIGKIARANNIVFHTDSVQAIGSLDINVKKMNIDSLSMSGHKFYAPKGIGVLYVRNGIKFLRQQDGGHQEKEKRSGTENVAGIVGIGKAIEIASKDRTIYSEKMRNLRDTYVRSVINNFSNVFVNGDIENRLAGNMNISFLGYKGAYLVEELDRRGICTSSGSACSAGLPMPSGVLMNMSHNVGIAESSLRVTFGKENTMDDVKYLLYALNDILKK
ncbi:MAG: cysteine desulfurase [Clostridia bacterium]|nr:cysteine desulfurase [Clostridia bacterium]